LSKQGEGAQRGKIPKKRKEQRNGYYHPLLAMRGRGDLRGLPIITPYGPGKRRKRVPRTFYYKKRGKPSLDSKKRADLYLHHLTGGKRDRKRGTDSVSVRPLREGEDALSYSSLL